MQLAGQQFNNVLAHNCSEIRQFVVFLVSFGLK